MLWGLHSAALARGKQYFIKPLLLLHLLLIHLATFCSSGFTALLAAHKSCLRMSPCPAGWPGRPTCHAVVQWAGVCRPSLLPLLRGVVTCPAGWPGRPTQLHTAHYLADLIFHRDLISHHCSEVWSLALQAGQDGSTQLPNGRDLADPAASGPSDPAEPVPQREQPPPVQSVEAARARSAALPPGRTGLPHIESFNTDVVQENLERHRNRRQQQQQEGGRALSHTGGGL